MVKRKQSSSSSNQTPNAGNMASAAPSAAASAQRAEMEAPAFPPTSDMPQPEGLTNIRSQAAKPNEHIRNLMGKAAGEPPRRKESTESWPFWTGIGLTFAWFAIVFFVVMDASVSGQVAGFPISSVALGISGVMAPVAFLWMVVAYLQRASDIKAITDPLRRQLQMVVGTGAQAEGRVRRFNETLERQLDLLRQAGDGSYDVLQNAIQVLQDEEKAITTLAERSGKEIQRIAGIVRDNSEVLEDLLHDNRERFHDLSGRVASSIADLDERAGTASNRMGDLLNKLNGLITQFRDVADEKLALCATMSSQVGEQEKNTAQAAQRMSETLEAARLGAAELNKILLANQEMLDQSGQRLMARMNEVSGKVKEFTEVTDEREQKLADKSRTLSQTLSREIATLEALTGRLESQISAANEGLGSHTDELEAKQTRLAEQAGSLMQNIQSTVHILDHNTQTVFEKFNQLRNRVAEQSDNVMQQFDASGAKYSTLAEKLDDVSKNVAERVAVIGTGLDAQVEAIARNSEKAVSASQDVHQGVSGAMEKLEIMIGRIFDAEKQAGISTQNIVQTYDGMLGTMQQRVGMIGQTAQQHVVNLAQHHDAFEGVAERLAARARETEGTWQSLVEAAEKQQESLQNQLRVRMHEAVELLNENAAAIESARDNLHTHIEAGFSKSQELIDQLARVGEMTDAPFNEAVARVKGCVASSEEQISRFVGVLHKNADQMNEVSNTLAMHGERAGHKAAEALAGLDAVSARMEAIQNDNMQTTQDVLLRLDRLVAQLQSRMGDLSSTASDEQKKLGETVKQLSFDINGLIHDSQSADNRIRIVAGLLNQQAGSLRGSLEEQVQSIETITARYHELSQLSQSGIDERISGLGSSVHQALDTLQNLGGAIDERTTQLGLVQGRLHEGSRAVNDATQQALDRLSVFTHALVAAQTTSGETAQTVFARLQDMETQFNRQITSVNEGSETIVRNMRQAVADLVEQSVGLAATSQQAEGRVESLAKATAELQNQAQIVRMAIETEASAMQNRMGDVLAEIETACVGLERNANIAFDRTEGMAKRFDKISDAAYTALTDASAQIGKVADESVGKIAQVSKSLADQVAGITFAGEHLGDVANEVGGRLDGSVQMLGRLAAEVGSKGIYAAEQLRLQVKGLQTESEIMLGQFSALGQGLAHQSLGFLSITDGIQKSVADVTESLRCAQEDAYRTRQQIVGETIEFKNEIAAGAQTINAVGDALAQRGDFAIAMVHQMAARFTETTQNLKDQFETQASRVQRVTEEAESNLQRLGTTLEGHADTLGATTEKLSGSGATIGETLEKANFLLRNLTGQIERMKGSASEISESFVKRMTDTLAACDAELKGMGNNAGEGLDTLNAKAKQIGQSMKEEAEMVASEIAGMLKTMQEEVGTNLLQVAETTQGAVTRLRENSAELSEAMRKDTETALAAPAQALLGFQEQFRETFVGMSDAIVSNLRQIQETGSTIAARVREGAEVGREESLQILAGLREAAATEVRSMTNDVETTMRQMHVIAERVHQELSMSGEEAQRAAMLSLASLRTQMEQDMQILVNRANGALADLQGTCLGLVQEMNNTAQSAEAVQAGADHVMKAVGEIGQGLSSTNALLQRSQSNLFEVAQKSSEALGLFNETLDDHKDKLEDLQTNYAQVAENMAATDARMGVIKNSFEQTVGGLMQQLNQNMMELGQQIISVRNEAGEATGMVAEGSELLGQQKATVMALTQALAQLQNVNRSLSGQMQESVEETTQQVDRFEQQTERVRRASENTSQWVTSLSQHMQGQLSQLAREMEKTNSMAAVAPAHTPAPRQPQTQPVQSVQPAASDDRSDALQRLRTMAASKATIEEMDVAPVAAPAASVSASPRRAVIEPAAAKPKAKAGSDDELLRSLNDIIQQLEESSGGDGHAPQRKQI